jgi:amidohydrolase
MPDNWQQAIDAAVDDRFARMVELRRRLHTYPEVSGEERETSLYLYQLLGDEGFEVRMGPEGRGVVADEQECVEEGPFALRADIDALRIHDAKHVAYRSRCDGVMHACGHDAHTATVFGAMSALRAVRLAGKLPWDIGVRGIFQPSEETIQGAQEMIEVGAVEGVQAIVAAHVDPTIDLGRIGLRVGVLTANCDEMRITVSGRGGHAARPHETSDPIAAAAQLINALYLYVPRVTDSQEAVVVTIGQVDGGDNANVIPELVMLGGTLRSLDRNVRRHTMEHICRLAHGIGETTETKIQVHFGLGSHSICNDQGIIELLSRAARDSLGPNGVHEIPRPSMGSEDFAFYLNHVPGAMFRLGCTSGRAGGAMLHTPIFDIDEEALRNGAKIMARTVVHWFAPERNSLD